MEKEQDDAPDADGDEAEDIHDQAMAAFKRASEAEEENRRDALDDLEFARLAKQWPDEVKKQRENDGRPCLTFNRMPAFIRQVVNDSRLNRPAIKIHPVDSGSDPKTAEVLDGLIRNIQVSSNADVAYDTAIDQAVSGGFGYWRVGMDYACEDTFDLDLMIERIANQFTVYGDPDSTAADSSDWDVAFVTEMLSQKEFKRRYPEASAANFEAGDTDRDASWFTTDEIRIAEYWRRVEESAPLYLMQDGSVLDEEMLEQQQQDAAQMGLPPEAVQPVQQRDGKRYRVTQYIITGAEVLEQNDWPGRYIPIVPCYGDEVWIEGRRYLRSLIRDAKDPQRSYNYWRTSATEKVALESKAPWIAPEGVISGSKDAKKWASANNKNHPYLEYKPQGNGPGPERQYAQGVPAGDMAMTAQAADDMKAIVGIYDSSLGARSNETSGVAISKRQHESDVSTFHFIDNLSRAIRHTGRILVDLIPHVYTTQRIVRVLGEDNRPAPIVPGQPPGMVPVNQPLPDLGHVFDLTAGKYDVTVETGPSFSTRREEAADQMTQLVQAQPGLMPIIGDLVVKSMDIPGGDDIAKRLQNMVPPQAMGMPPQQQGPQGPNPQQAQQMVQQLQQLQAQVQQLTAQNQQLNLQLADKSEKNANEARANDIKAHQAETDRLKVLVDANRPPPQPSAPHPAGPAPAF